MKKTKQFHNRAEPMAPEQIAKFLEDFAKVATGRDQKTKLISLRVPENVLGAFKVKAAQEQRKYQTVIVELMREWVTGVGGQA